MNYILTMSLSGTVMLMLYYIIKRLAGDRLSNQWKYRLIKAAILYYLIPLGFLEKGYKYIIDKMTKTFSREVGIVQILAEQKVVFYADDQIILNDTLKKEICLLTLWLLVAVGIFARKYYQYLRNKKYLMHCKGVIRESNENQLWKRLSLEYGVKKVLCFGCSKDSPLGERAFTLGVFHPIIFYPCDASREEQELILRHELTHIQRKDVLWSMLMYGVTIVHWYNPFVWWMRKELEAICEMSCDDRVMQDKDETQRRQYGMLIIDMATKDSGNELWSFAMSKKGLKMKARVENVMSEKGKLWGKIASACIVASLVLVNSLTVFAYEDVVVEVMEDVEEHHLEGLEHCDMVFIPDDATEEERQKISFYAKEYEILYDLQFTDEQGNIYPIQQNDIQTYAICDHNYIKGSTQRHIAKADGSCLMIIYEATMCTNCHHVSYGDEIGRNTYNPCPH